MKKYISLILVINLFFSSFLMAANAISSIDNKTIKIETIHISGPVIKYFEESCEIFLEESNSYLLETGKPAIPIINKVITLPFGSKIKNINVETSDIRTIKLMKELKPCSAPVPLNQLVKSENKPMKDINFYSSDELFPIEWYSYSAGSGLKNLEHVVYLTIQCYPVRYSPKENIIYYIDTLDVEINFEEPPSPIVFPDEYQMVVIAPEIFSDELEPLIKHKNNPDIDLKTILKTTEDIYDEYTGFDKPEQIKFFIKDAIETWGIDYVLLCGGLNSLIKATPKDDVNQGSIDWYVPVRYTNVKEVGGTYDPGYISDLYFADIYDSEGNFSTWDKDKNGESDGIYANWKVGGQKDIIDLFPDVYVGRLACRNEREVTTMVNKIIYYETTTLDSSWFNKLVLIGGDTFDDTTTYNYYEGEVENQKAIEYMSEFDPVKIWSSNRETGGLVPEPKDVTSTVSEGCGFLFFAGHGSPELWETHWAGGPFERSERTKSIMWYHLLQLSNANKLPICVVGSCHGSQFNVTGMDFLDWWLNEIGEILGLDFLKRPTGNVVFPTPECFTWVLTKINSGGSIATIGNTGIGYGRTGDSGDLDGDGVDDPDCVEKLGGFLETQFFKSYGVKNIDVLGETWGDAITSYLTIFDGMKDQTDCKTVQQWVLFGDPSLKIGGY